MLTFKELSVLQKGDTVWEYTHRMTLTTHPHIKVNGGHSQMTFKAHNEDIGTVNYLITEGLEHYGPKLSKYQEYFTHKEILNF